MKQPTNYLEVPTYNGDTKTYTKTIFQTKEDFLRFVEPLLKYPGEYDFDENYLVVNEQANNFKKNGFYCDKPFKSKDFINYWNNEKDKCTNGLIIHSGEKTWYVTRDYYMWLNFLPIYHKEKRLNLFPDLYDGQYHIALFELIGELKGLHIVFLKKRQYAQSYYHMSKLINQLWFEQGVTLKLLAYEDSYINMEGSWNFLVDYRDFLNENTAWYRPFQPDEVGNWLQRIKVTENGRDNYKGRKGRLIGKSTKQSPTKGVGGASRYVIVEEGGVNPTLDKTYGYAKSALQAGPLQTTGQFIVYGSVGDLKQCEPLKEFMKKPLENGFYGIPTRDYDSSGIEKVAGLFAPESWNLLGYTDKYGNSDVQGAKQAILDLRLQQKKDLSPEAYRLEVSQHPLTIEEAFAFREESPFPTHLIAKQLDRINNNEYPSENLELFRNDKGEIECKKSKKLPISEFPLSKKALSYEKEGCIVVYERPNKDKKWGTYFASIDPLSEGNSTTSNSLCSIFVYKNSIQVTKEHEDGTIENYVEGDKIVAEWCGRFDDINKTHELLEMLIEWYNAWTLVEANVGLFFTYMTLKKKTHYLVPSNQMIFNRELSGSYKPSHPWGWKNVGSIFKTHLLSSAIEFMSEEINHDISNKGDKVNIKYGIERIPSKMLLVECKDYVPGLNVDRLVAFAALVAFVKIQQATRTNVVKIYHKQENVNKNYNQKIIKPFKSVNNSFKRSAFKNYR